MPAPTFSFSAVLTSIRSVLAVFADLLTFFRLSFRSPAAVSAENLFLRKQLGLYVERKVKPRRATNAIRFTLARLSRLFDWQNASADPIRLTRKVADIYLEKDLHATPAAVADSDPTLFAGKYFD